MTNPKLSFLNEGRQRGRRLKDAPAHYSNEKISPNIEMADGIHPPLSWAVHRYLPVKRQNITTDDWIVIPKGRLVSNLLVTNDVFDGKLLSLSTEANSAVGYILLENAVPVATDTVTITDANGDSAVFEFVASEGDGAEGTDVEVILGTDPDNTIAHDGAALAAAIDASALDVSASFDTATVTLTIEDASAGDPAISATFDTEANVDVTDFRRFSLETGQEDEITGAPMGVPVDSYYGIPRHTPGFLVPANGGSAVTFTYGANDVLAGVPSVINSGSPVAEDETYSLPANIPIGMAMYDFYQDISGAFLNYDKITKQHGVTSKKLIKIPFVDIARLEDLTEVSSDKFLSGSSKTAGGLGSVSEMKDGYSNVEKYYSFLTFNSSQSAHGLGGMLLKGDLYGNYMPESSPLSASRTAQTVGRLYAVDTRLPKDMLDTVQGQYGQRDGSSNTAGLDFHMWRFGELLFNGLGISWPSDKDKALYVLAAVQSGAIGYAYIQLHIA